MNKTTQIQLRVTPAQKSALVRRARSEGMDLSAWMLRRLAPPESQRLGELVAALAKAMAPSFELAAIHDLLRGLHRADFHAVTEGVSVSGLDALRANYLAAMVEATAARLEQRPPAWVSAVKALEVPWFATGLLSLRLHLLSSSPAPFRARNLFVDATVGDRV